MKRLIGLAVVAVTAVVAVAMFATPAAAQVQICSNTGYATASGTTACSGAASPVAASATVRTSAKLTLETVFGAAAGGLAAAFGNVDAFCLTAPGAGISCAADTVNNRATWYGDIGFSVKLSGLGVTTAKLTGQRPAAAGTIPSGQLLDGASGAEPNTAYPISPAAAQDLTTGLGNGNNSVTRSIGVRVLNTDAAAAWSSNAQYSVVIE
jgi:hypothetical protein